MVFGADPRILLSVSADPAKPGPEGRDPWLDDFLRHVTIDRGLSDLSHRNYAAALREFRSWYTQENGREPDWSALTRDTFRAFLRSLGRRRLSSAAIRLRFSALRTFYGFLRNRGRATQSPLRQLALPRLPRRLPRFLTADQVSALLAAPLQELDQAEPKPSPPAERARLLRDAAWLETLYSCGLRISELCRLEVHDVEFTSQRVRVRGKGKKERQVPIGAPALRAIEAYWGALDRWPAPDSLVFRASRDSQEPLVPRMVQLILKRYLLAAGLDPALTPHKIRHSYATHLLDRGADLRSVQELLGHAHLATTEVYTHVTTERLKRVYDAAHPRA